MNNLDEVRVRFAPSPTGHLHVGGVRTALFNWLYAKNKKGKFVLRIEDTDRKRSTQEALDAIMQSMKWLDIDWDTGPIFQSERLGVYTEYAEKLIELGLAFKSTRAKKIIDGVEGNDDAGADAELPQGEVIVFKSIHQKIIIDDLVHGAIEFDTSLIDDFIIVKSDGMPTYNFACVVDDAVMKISHVIRGDDHISNTPKQIMVYQALGFPVPKFAHVPMILGPDGTRLSKRHGATSVEEFRRQGFLPEALLNFLALLGWSPGEDKEILSLNEIIDCFSLRRITGKSAVFNIDKLTWMNSVYISKLKDEELIALCRPVLEQAGLLQQEENIAKLGMIIPLFKERIKLINEIVTATEYFFKDKIDYQENAVNKYLKLESAKVILVRTKEILCASDDIDKTEVEEKLRALIAELGLKTKVIMQTIRVAITGGTASAGIFETIIAMGKSRTLKHIDLALEIASR